MDKRLPELLKVAESKDVRFNWVLLMGGVNDLRRGDGNATRLFEGLQSLYAACHAHGARVLAMTVLQSGWTPRALPAEREPARQRLNELIRGAAKQHSDYITLLDTDKLLPLPANPAADPAAALLWDDGLHLSPAGYNRLGELVFTALRDKLPQAKAKTKTQGKTQAKPKAR
ncbi:hypothetical protein GPECTOR_313g4 [Gonium pectorale]|uniref:SGNH hydrolase-type esterase domain-containing protein n=1 Tax=Gonium pectorale TaxID=33097 RepID=A0A150FVQ8_GONPE|nr:hypothetical protein GPECTOR_313g4 [Gonium pectorale]|eukprot:KXZ41702.1 hypothetical protein GPECTOR_313g4 [Gonium pectorale]